MKRIIVLTTAVCSLNLVYALSGNSMDNGMGGSLSNVGSRNDSASCDSTCMAQAQQQSHESNLQQRIIPCVSGFTGTRLQTRIKLANGTWGPWTDKNIDNCNCVPTSKTQTSLCEAPLKGTFIEKSNWTCTTPKSGVWSDWFLETNGCYTPCAPLPPETRTVACPAGYKGTQQVQQRTSSCSADEKQAPVWSSWTNVSSDCVKEPTPEPVHPCASSSNWYFYNVVRDTSSGVDSLGPWTRTCNTDVYACTYTTASGLKMTETSYRSPSCQVSR